MARERPRLRLIHWHADEAAERMAQLEAAGFEVEHRVALGPELLRELSARPPVAVVIDLTRSPSQGRDVALALRVRKGTRGLPLVFVGGEPAKVVKIGALLPDAVYTDWDHAAVALRRAIAAPPPSPVVPASTLAGYSGTPLPKKLGIKEGTRVALLGAPADFRQTLGELPAGAILRDGRRGAADLWLWFVRSGRELEAGMADTAARLGEAALWIVWPKKTSSLATDVGEKEIRATGLAAGLVDFKVCAVDATWSGLKFVVRRKR